MVAYGRHLRKAVAVALVGTALFVINQLDIVVHGDATTMTYVKGAITYLVPFTVSVYGLLVGTYRPSKE